MISTNSPCCSPSFQSFILFFSCFFSVFVLGWRPPFFLNVCASFIAENQGNKSLGSVSSRLGNSISQSVNCLARNLLYQCSRIATATVATAMARASVLFQICFNFSVTKFFSQFLQAYCSNIPFLKFELPITYNYAHNLNTQIIRN